MSKVWAHASFSRCIGLAVHEEIGNRRLLMFDFDFADRPHEHAHEAPQPANASPLEWHLDGAKRILEDDADGAAPFCARSPPIRRPKPRGTVETWNFLSATCHRRHSAERWPSSQYVARKNDSRRISAAQGPMLRILHRIGWLLDRFASPKHWKQRRSCGRVYPPLELKGQNCFARGYLEPR
ncbi:hypothetical protein DFJ74DRAFT_100431 [Hyaloraphidium curvatum]|nr:hypothetical protein DFJ74DRAFT_100431 [Hyaloraphidium curvatum]